MPGAARQVRQKTASQAVRNSRHKRWSGPRGVGPTACHCFCNVFYDADRSLARPVLIDQCFCGFNDCAFCCNVGVPSAF